MAGGRSALYLGASRLGDGRLDHEGSARLADAFMHAGFDGVDTSNNYTEGRSEALLGAAISSAGSVPDGVALSTKADADPVTGAFDGDRVNRSFEESTQRLGVDRLPLYLLHDPYSITVKEAMSSGGAVEALVQLRGQGLVGAVGIAAGPLPLLAEYLATGAFDAVLSHNRFTLADRSAAGLFADARARGITVVNAAPFGGGILAGSAASAGRYAYRPASAALLRWVGRLGDLCASAGIPLAAAALDFSLHHPDVDATVVGITSLQRLQELRGLVNTPVPEELRLAIAELGDPPGNPP
ncbi:aldo/keto reductase [Arthrobacter sp. 35W]|uniref:aldo/keto reductase n=1 Tax=Arthrobacter sp. 35W TaxID=1132441 RepID=UPI0003FEF6A7|nr:aldo/keto reductase [Arthrobacter sp. 35W]